MKENRAPEQASFVPPMASSGAKLNKYQGKVEVPASEKNWVARLTSGFERLDYNTQVTILGILTEIQKLNPEEAKNAGRLLEEYFRGVGQVSDPKSLTETLTDRLQQEKNKKVQ